MLRDTVIVTGNAWRDLGLRSRCRARYAFCMIIGMDITKHILRGGHPRIGVMPSRQAMLGRVLVVALTASCLACEPRQESETPAEATESARSSTEAMRPLPEDGAVKAPESGPILAVAKIMARSGSDVAGAVVFRQEQGKLVLRGEITGLGPGRHGFHIHERGDCSASDASSAGGHFAPADDPHGAPGDPLDERHAGDLGNIVADQHGNATIGFTSDRLTLGEEGGADVLGRSLVVHAEPDDLESQPAGDAGARVGCGVIVAQSSAAL